MLDEKGLTDFLVSLRLFGDGGPSGLLKAISANVNGDVIERSWKESCGVDYLIARLARVELLLDARDSNLHPNVLRTSRKIQESWLKPGH